jgi:inhibitor of KinA sporulation pathway (predicted exonuclease)
MLANDCHLHKLESDWLEPHINVKAQYHQFKESKKHTGLANSLKKEGMDFEGIPHRAIDDAKNLAKIFIKYIDMWQY